MEDVGHNAFAPLLEAFPGAYTFNGNNTEVFDGGGGSLGPRDIWTSPAIGLPGDSAEKGYIIRMKASGGGVNILEHAYITILTNSTINANVIDWASIQAMGGPLVLDAGGTNRPNVDITGIGTIDANVIEWLGSPVSADASGTPNVNIVDWGGTDASGNPLTLAADTNGYPQVDASNGGIVRANVEEWLGSPVSADASGTPNVNIVDWGGTDASGNPLTLAADASGYPQVDASVGGIINSNVEEWLGSPVSADASGTPNVNIVDWGGWDASGNLLTLAADASGYPQVDASVGGIINSNVEEWLGSPVSADASGTPNVNIVDWGGWDASGNLLTLAADASGYPQVDIMRYAGRPARSSVHGMPDVNVMDWNGLTDSSGNPVRSANITAATTPETGTPGDGSGFPQITVAAWQQDLDLSGNPWPAQDDPIYVRQSMGGSNSDGSNNPTSLPAITVEGWGGDASANVSIGPVSQTPRITAVGWEGNRISAGNNAVVGNGEIAITWTRDLDTSGSPVDRPNVRTQIVANNAIDEDAIHIDSVTYEEISESAAQEISDAVWNADIFNSIYHPDPSDNSTSYAREMTIGRAMLVQYLSQNVNHWGVNSESPMHICNVSDASGNRFYSNRLATWPLTSDEIASYIDRAVVVVKDLVFDNVPNGVVSFDDATESYLGRITGVDSDGSGQYFEIKLVNEDEDSIPNGLNSGTDLLIVKAETDATMHEVAHEVWEESVFDHETADTFGMFSRIMTGLTQFNHRITDSIYDDSGRLLSCRLVVYPTACDAKNGTNALTTVEVTSTYDEKQNMETFLAKEESSDHCPEE
jgi:hypothetical protein